jgi:hypothetical protein
MFMKQADYYREDYNYQIEYLMLKNQNNLW